MNKTLKAALCLLGALVFIAAYGVHVDSTTPTAAPSPTCSVSDIDLEHLVHTRDDDSDRYDHVSGTITNNCDHAIGVGLRIEAKFDNGDVAYAESLWPASVTNIRAGDTYAFNTIERRPQGNIHVTVKVEEVRVWGLNQ